MATDQTGKVIAALVTALVEALDEKAPGLANAFSKRLEDAILRLGEETVPQPEAVATLKWARSLLSEEIDRSEPASVVYARNRTLDEDDIPSTHKVQLMSLDEALRFWSRLPDFDRRHAWIETASGHRIDAPAAAGLVRRLADRPSV